MKHIKILIALAAMLLVIGVTFSAAEGSPLSQEEMNKRWMAYATPSDGHKHLQFFVGDWKGDVKMWMEPNGKPMETVQTATGKMIMGGRYLEAHIKGKYQDMPFEGRQLVGYDNMKKEFLTHWIDNMGTGFYPSSGSLDKTGKTRSEAGVWVCPITGSDLNVRIKREIIYISKSSRKCYSITSHRFRWCDRDITDPFRFWSTRHYTGRRGNHKVCSYFVIRSTQIIVAL